MQIPINKDIEEAYRDEPIRGFTLREVAHIMLGALIIGGVTALVWWKTGLSPDISSLWWASHLAYRYCSWDSEGSRDLRQAPI